MSTFLKLNIPNYKEPDQRRYQQRRISVYRLNFKTNSGKNVVPTLVRWWTGIKLKRIDDCANRYY